MSRRARPSDATPSARRPRPRAERIPARIRDRLSSRAQATKDVLAPLRRAIEGVLTEDNKVYVLMCIVLAAPALIVYAHRLEAKQAAARARADHALAKKDD